MLIHRRKVSKRGAVKQTAPHNIPKAEVKNDEAVEVTPEVKEDETSSKYSKTEINRASTATLKEMAAEVGIDDADDKTGGELKKLIIEKLGL
jgi:DNA uptake protein ComE-like DNA-binding protein